MKYVHLPAYNYLHAGMREFSFRPIWAMAYFYTKLVTNKPAHVLPLSWYLKFSVMSSTFSGTIDIVENGWGCRVQGCHSLARTKFPTFSQPFPDPCSNFPNQRNAFGNLFNSINDWMFNDMHSREYILCKRVSQSDTMLGRQHLRMSQICMPGIITMTTRQHWRGRNPMFFLSKIFHFNQHQNDLNQ